MSSSVNSHESAENERQEVNNKEDETNAEEDEEEDEERESDLCIDLQVKSSSKRINLISTSTTSSASSTSSSNPLVSDGQVSKGTTTTTTVSNSESIPTIYAIPQTSTSVGNKFFMQPFILSTPAASCGNSDSENNASGSGFNHSLHTNTKETTDEKFETKEEEKVDESFVPSLVYLPVVKKIDEPVTVAFHLTPA